MAATQRRSGQWLLETLTPTPTPPSPLTFHPNPNANPNPLQKRKQLQLIDTPQLLKEKIELVEALGNIEMAARVIDTGKGSGFDVHPVDLRYKQLGAELTPVDRGGELHVLLESYLQKTHASTHSTYTLELQQAFEVAREGEAKAFKDVGNRQLLWHGSRLTNWCGILSQGLRIAPPEAPATGYMFGKGVYFADCSSKSANYCFANKQSSTGVLLLSEVPSTPPAAAATSHCRTTLGPAMRHPACHPPPPAPHPACTPPHPLTAAVAPPCAIR